MQVPYYHHQPSVLSSTPKWRRIRERRRKSAIFATSEAPPDLDLDLRLGRCHTGAHMVEVYPHTELDRNLKNCGHTDGRVSVRPSDGWTDGWTDTPEFQSTRSSPGDDLIKLMNKVFCPLSDLDSRSCLQTKLHQKDDITARETSDQSNLT